MEIERKYAILHIPGDLATYSIKQIEQGYLCHNPVVRIRKSNEDYILTYKSRDGIDKSKQAAIVRHEVELPLTEKAYETLRGKTEGNIVYKTRYMIPLQDGRIAELDVFEGVLKGLVFVEVEFPDINSAEKFIPPDWFGEELSQDSRFSNYYLSKLNSIEELCL